MRLWSHRIRGPDRPITTNLLGATCKGRAYSRGESNNTTFHTHIWGRRWAAAGPEELAITRAPLRAVAPHRKAGGPGWEDRCARAFNTVLEDIEHSEYYRLHGAPPGKGAALSIQLGKRLIAVTANGQSVGNLPTALNYLAACLKDGWRYTGLVTDSSVGPPSATVAGDFGASRA
jgi:hypothetical protein